MIDLNATYATTPKSVRRHRRSRKPRRTNTNALKVYLDQKNKWDAIFGKGPIAMPTDEATARPVFEMLASDLSPENLSCDGEAPLAYVRRQKKLLETAWRNLEGIIGRRFDEGELYS